MGLRREVQMSEIKLGYLNSFTDSRGKRRHVFRRKGHKKKTIKGTPGSKEFMDHYNELVEKTGGTAQEIGASKSKAGTIDTVMVAFFKSNAFKKGLAQETQNTWRPILDRFREHLTPSGKRRFGENPVSTLREKSVKEFLDVQSTANAQKNALTAIRGFIRYAISQKFLASDPTEEIKFAKADGPKSMGHMTWLEPQVEQYRKRHALGTVARVALELLLNIAARSMTLTSSGSSTSSTPIKATSWSGVPIRHSATPASCSQSGSCQRYRPRWTRCRRTPVPMAS